MKIREVTRDDIDIPNLKCIFYGQSGSGKTHLALTFPAPLILNLEMGTGILTGFTSVEGVKSYDDCKTFLQFLDQDKGDKYRTIVIDSIDELMHIIVQSEVLQYSTKRPYDDQLTQADYGKLGRTTMAFCRDLLRYSMYYNIIFIMSENPNTYENEQKQPGSMGKVVKSELPRLVDLFGCVMTNKEGVHKLSLSNTSISVGKNRFNLPNTLIDNTYESIISMIESSYSESDQ